MYRSLDPTGSGAIARDAIAEHMPPCIPAAHVDAMFAHFEESAAGGITLRGLAKLLRPVDHGMARETEVVTALLTRSLELEALRREAGSAEHTLAVALDGNARWEARAREFEAKLAARATPRSPRRAGAQGAPRALSAAEVAEAARPLVDEALAELSSTLGAVHEAGVETTRVAHARELAELQRTGEEAAVRRLQAEQAKHTVALKWLRGHETATRRVAIALLTRQSRERLAHAIEDLRAEHGIAMATVLARERAAEVASAAAVAALRRKCAGVIRVQRVRMKAQLAARRDALEAHEVMAVVEQLVVATEAQSLRQTLHKARASLHATQRRARRNVAALEAELAKRPAGFKKWQPRGGGQALKGRHQALGGRRLGETPFDARGFGSTTGRFHGPGTTGAEADHRFFCEGGGWVE